MKARVCGNQLSYHCLRETFILPWGGPEPGNMLWSLDMVHFHFTPSSRAHQLQNWNFYFPQYTFRMIFKDP